MRATNKYVLGQLVVYKDEVYVVTELPHGLRPTYIIRERNGNKTTSASWWDISKYYEKPKQ